MRYVFCEHKTRTRDKVIDRLAVDLRHTFPEMQGFSSYPEEQFVQQVAAQIPWFHNCLLLDKVKDPGKREWYIRQTIENGRSRSVLVPEGNRSQIATGSNEAIAKS